MKPYNIDKSKKTEVKQMFGAIAPTYDKLNHRLSLSIDKLWRRRVVKLLKDLPHEARVLDVATGTADLAILIAKKLNINVIGTDLTPEMLAIGKQKVEANNLGNLVQLQEADSEKLPFDDNTFDAVTVAFGVRNYENLDRGLEEMGRVLRKGGRMVILEFSHPQSFPFKQLYMFYFKHILPTLGGCISHDKKAYEYLPASVIEFPCGAEFEAHLTTAGLKPVKRRELTFGVATIYVAEKVS